MRINLKANEITLLISATLIALLWVFTQHLTFTGDSTTYLQYAQWLGGTGNLTSIWYLRTPGLPIFLILSGLVHSGSFLGFMFLQALVSVLNVWLIYKICVLMQPRFANLIAWLSILSSVPFIFSTMVMTEHLNMCATLCLVYSLILFAQNQTAKTIWLIAASTLLLFLLRPSNYYLFVIPLFCIVAFSQQQRWRNVRTFLLIYGLVSLCYVLGFSLLKLSHPGGEGLSAVFQGVRTLAFQPYMAGAIDANSGPNSADLIETVNQYIQELSENSQLAQQVFTQPNGFYYNFIAKAMVEKYGRSIAGRKMCFMALETFVAKPKIFFNWVRSLFSSSANNYTGQMLYYPLMLKAPYIAQNESQKPHTKIEASNGPATAEILQLVENYIYTQQDKWDTMQPLEYFAKFKGQPQELLKNIRENPNHTYHWFIWQLMDRSVGPTRASQLFLAAALEGYKNHPQAVLSLLDDLYSYFLGQDVTYKTGRRVLFLPTPGVGEQTIPPGASAQMIKQIKSPSFELKASFWPAIYTLYGILWLLAKPLIFFAAIVGIFSAQRPVAHAYMAIWLLVLYNALITCVFADPFFRYSALTWLLTFLLAAHTTFSWLGQRFAKRNFIWYNNTAKTLGS